MHEPREHRPSPHQLSVEWKQVRYRTTMYWAECSCGWETAFETTRESIAVDMAQEHAKRVQAHAVEREGQYV